jgi:hypothetical protein
VRRSLSSDQSAEMSQHPQLRLDTGLPVHFCDPSSPWQRRSNENTNGLLRQYFPKGTDFPRAQRPGFRCRCGDAQQPARQNARLEKPAEALNGYLRLSAASTPRRLS